MRSRCCALAASGHATAELPTNEMKSRRLMCPQIEGPNLPYRRGAETVLCNTAKSGGRYWTDLIKAGNRKNFAIEIISVQRDGKYAYQTAKWTFDLLKDTGEVAKVAGNSVRIFEEQPDGKWLCKVHIYNFY
jgi:hypothetical protein